MSDPYKLDSKGRCCGRKPLVYKTPYPDTACCPHAFCVRCDRAFNPATGEQVQNWAYRKKGIGFVKTSHFI